MIETPSKLFFFTPIKYHKYTKKEKTIIDELVKNYRSYYIGRDKEKIISKINKFIDKHYDK